MRITAVGLACVAMLASARLGAQVCEPPTSSNEAKIFGNRSLAFAHGRATALGSDPAGTIRIGVELAMLPHISDATARPTTCRPEKGPENVNLLPGIARLRVSLALPHGLALDASWLPPVELKGMNGNLASLAASYTRAMSSTIAATARVHATVGTVTGPITCDEDALQDASSECFQGTLSDDSYKPNIAGADLAASWQRAGRSVAWYAGGGYTRLTPRFQVHFVDRDGNLDRTRVQVDLNRVALFAGAGWSLSPHWRTSGEVYATTADGATLRVVIDRAFRRGR